MPQNIKNVIMMHNPKVAGSYLMKLLNSNKVRYHRSSHDNVYAVKKILGPVKWDRAFKFSFVRNPWDRVASWYFFHTRLFDKMDFPGFVDLICNGKLNDIQEAVMFTNRPFWMHSVKKGMVNPLYQHQYTDGVDFIGKYENIEIDTVKLMKKIGFSDYKDIAPVNVSPHKKKGYHQYYTDKMKNMISVTFKEDITEYKYEF